MGRLGRFGGGKGISRQESGATNTGRNASVLAVLLPYATKKAVLVGGLLSLVKEAVMVEVVARHLGAVQFEINARA